MILGFPPLGLAAVGFPALSARPLIPGSFPCPGAKVGAGCMPGSACARGLCQAQGHFGMRGGSQENKCSPGFLQPHPAPGTQGKMKAVAVTVLLLLASMCLQAQAGVCRWVLGDGPARNHFLLGFPRFLLFASPPSPRFPLFGFLRFLLFGSLASLAFLLVSPIEPLSSGLLFGFPA